MNLATFDLNLLRVLDALLREGSTVRAAAVLHLSQPAVSAALGEWVEAPLGDVLGAYRERDVLHGREVSWEGAGVEPGCGRAAGIDDRGNLVVERPGAEPLRLGSGEVSLRPR